MSNKKKMSRGEGSTTEETANDMDFKGRKMDMKSIMKDIEFLSSSHMTWKERKDMENRKVVALGGKPPKEQRLPLSVARVPMKKQKEREQKMLQENLILGRFGASFGNGTKKLAEKRKPEDKVLKATEGRFRNGVLEVNHLLRPSGTRENDNIGADAFFKKGKEKKGGGKKNRGKKEGGGKKRH